MNSPSGGIGVLLKAAKNLSDDGFDVALVYEPRQDQKASYEASAKAKKQLNWFPRISFKDLVKIMVDYDLELLGLPSPGDGKKAIQEKGLTWSEKEFYKINGQKL